MSQQYRLFIGNPGVGKSTLINCLTQKNLFKSGISIGAGLTTQLQQEKHDGVVYMDTPGLSDVELRKAAAEAITEALKQNGMYQIFFVVTLEAGRVRPVDLTTIKIVLENAKDITNYSIIVNKLTKPEYKKLLENEERNFKQLLAELNYGSETNVEAPTILLLMRESSLDDLDDKYTNIEKLNDFVNDAPSMTVFPDHVKEIPSDDSFDRINARFEEELNQLRQNSERMKAKLEEAEEKYRKAKNDNEVQVLHLSSFFSKVKYRI